MNTCNLKKAYFQDSILALEVLPFIYLDGRRPRLPRKQSKGYNLIEDTKIFFDNILRDVDILSYSRYKVTINVNCGKDGLGKADLDNYSKAILDGISNSKKIWYDDKQIDDLHITRIFSENKTSKILIKIQELNES